MHQRRKKVLVQVVALLATAVIYRNGASAATDIVPKDIQVTSVANDNDNQDEPSVNNSGEGIVAIHVDAVGTKEQLRPSLRGLSYMASTFLAPRYKLVEVLSASREVVAGVRFELTASAEDVESSQKQLCHLVILEKPWITTEFGEKQRTLEYSNCTSSDDDTQQQRVEVNTRINPTFDQELRSVDDPLSPDRLDAVIGQVIVEKHEVLEITSAAPSSTTEKSTLSEGARDALDQLFMFGSQAAPAPPRRTEDDRPMVEEAIIVPKKVEDKQFAQGTTIAPSLNQHIQSTFDEVFKTHQEIQKALDEVVANGGGRDTQIKYNPVFDSLLQKVKASIDNYYQATNGGDPNIDTAAFVVRDNAATTPASTTTQTPDSDEDLQQVVQQQIVPPNFNLQPPKIEGVTMVFGTSAEDFDSQKTLTKEQLAQELNADDTQQRQKRDASDSYEFGQGFPYHDVVDSHSWESHKHHGHYGHHYPYYRGRRSIDTEMSSEMYRKYHIDLDVPEKLQDMKRIVSAAMARLDEVDTDPYLRVILEVLDAAIVPQSPAAESLGTVYVVQALIANSHCAEGRRDPTEECEKLLVADTMKACTLEVRVKDHDNIQPTKTKCQGIRNNNVQRPGLVGGAMPVDVTKPEHIERISRGLQSYDSGKHSEFSIRYGTVQVVAGQMHRYKIDLTSKKLPYSTCDVEVFTPLTGDAQYEFKCVDLKARRHRRDTSGKKMHKAPKVGTAAEMTPEEYNKEEHLNRIRTGLLQSSDVSKDRKFKVVSGTQQKVSGTLYTYRIIFLDDPDKHVCKITSWERPWLNEKSPSEAQKISLNCANEPKSRSRRGCPGCPTSLKPEEYNTPEHQERINRILSSFNGVKQTPPQIINATRQIVSGSLYTYYISHKTPDEQAKTCKLTSWEQPWLPADEANKYTFDCPDVDHPSTSRRRRQANSTAHPIVGGKTEFTAEELKEDNHINRVNRVLASYGLQAVKYKIVKGWEQVVAGVLYEYTIEYDVDGEKKSCELSSWERPWLDKSDPTAAYKYSFECADGKRAQRHSKKLSSSNELTAEELKDKSHLERIKTGMTTYNMEKAKSYEVSEIVTGSTQQVAGSLYKYTFRVKDEPDVTCEISIWERVWLESQDQRKYNTKCTGDEESEQDKHETVKRSARNAVHSTHEMSNERRQFDKFKLRHKRKYGSTHEHELRFHIFRQNLHKIDQLNKHEQGTAKYGVTNFADMTETEYRQHTGLVMPKDIDANHIRNPMATLDENFVLPVSFDWRSKGAVSPVKNQGSCGSCWAFSVIGNIEGLHQIKTGKLEEYSEQELLDCDTVDHACQGGEMDDAYKAIEKIGGLEFEKDYPYIGKKQATCQFDTSLSRVRLSGAVDLPKNETAMAQYLVTNGPISIGLNANAMQFYRGGISHPWHPLCSKKSLDHGVLIVGYGVKEYPMFNKTLPYWIVKNSWGPRWGEQGYYRIYRGDNSCGVSEMASSAVLE